MDEELNQFAQVLALLTVERESQVTCAQGRCLLSTRGYN